MTEDNPDRRETADDSGTTVDSGPTDDERTRRDALESGVVALGAGVAAVAGSYAIAGFTPGFVAAPVSDVVVALTPDAVVTWSIQTLGSLGAQLGFLLALALTTLLFSGAAFVASRLAARVAVPAAPAVTLACVAVAVALSGALAASVTAGVAAGLVVAIAALGIDGSSASGDAPAAASTASAARRRVLQAVGASVAIGVGGTVLGDRQGGSVPSADGGVSDAVQSLLSDADGKSLDVAGIEPLVSQNFYQVDINSVDPTVEADSWTLSLTGAVEEEVTFSYDDLTSMDAEHRFVTLRCVGEGLNGKKMDTALWTGVPVTDLLAEAGVELPEECCVMLRAADDYFEEFPLAALEDGFLAYEMNGKPLPRGHGHPVRALIPGHWGEINVKWLTEIEVLEEEATGYWEKRGWHGTGPVETVAKLHAVNHRDDGSIQVGGHAYAGTRGIEQVEVSTDGGRSWTDATLSEPLPGDDVWRQWRYEYEKSSSHEVVVRATDGTGTLQPKEESKAFPSGPTGWVSKQVEP